MLVCELMSQVMSQVLTVRVPRPNVWPRAGARLPATKRLQLWGAADKELLAAVAQDPAVSLLAVHLAPGKLPAWLLGLLRSSPVPVLLHKSGDGGIAS